MFASLQKVPLDSIALEFPQKNNWWEREGVMKNKEV